MTTLAISALRCDGGTQPRNHISEDVARRYIDDMVAGAVFPPVVAFYDGADYWVADGFHRLEAYRAREVVDVEVEVHQGTQRDAILYSVGANATHGYPRSNADKRRAAFRLLNDEEWSKWTDREIARRCCVSHDFVSRLHSSLSPNDSERTYTTKHGTVSTMKTANIGRRREADPIVDNEHNDDPTPLFPPEHTLIAGHFDYFIENLDGRLDIGAAEMAVASARPPAELLPKLRRLVAFLTEYEKEISSAAYRQQRAS